MALRTRREGWVGFLFCVPALGFLSFSVIIPFLLALGITLTDQRLLSPNPTRVIGLENYRRLLGVRMIGLEPLHDDGGRVELRDDGEPKYPRLRTVLRERGGYAGYQRLSSVTAFGKRWVVVARDPVFYRSLFNTFLFVVMVIPLQCGTALALALLVNRALPGTTIFRTLYFAPVVTSMVVVSIVWSFLYNSQSGLINQLFSALTGGWFEGADWLGSEWLALPAIAVMSAWQGAGFQMLIFLAGLQSIDQHLYEAADLEGADRWQKFRYVTLPSLKNTMVFVIVSTTIMAFGLFIQVDVMTKGGPNDSTSTLIFHAVRTGFRELDIAYGSTVAVIFFVLVLGVSLLQRAVVERDP